MDCWVVIHEPEYQLGNDNKESASHFIGLLKSAEMLGAQEPRREAYILYVERRGLQRNNAD